MLEVSIYDTKSKYTVTQAVCEESQKSVIVNEFLTLYVNKNNNFVLRQKTIETKLKRKELYDKIKV